MKLFLDSAKLDEIRYAIQKWHIDGITTNPRHLLAANMTVEKFAEEVKKLVEGTQITVSLEVNPHLQNPLDIVEEAKRLASLSPNFVIKVPASEVGFEALAQLSKQGVKVNMTLVFTPFQALQAARLGAYYISVFVGWKEERGDIDTELLSKTVKIVKNYGFPSKVLVAAVRSVKHIVDAALAGADIVTASWEVYKRAFENPYTQLGLDIFSKAWDGMYGGGGC